MAAGAAERAAPFGGAELARLAGLWHDIGKYSEAFQRYLTSAGSSASHQADSKGRIDHSTAGAQLAATRLGIPGHMIAFTIAGHHAGLADSFGERSALISRLRKEIEPFAAPECLVDQEVPGLPAFVHAAMHEDSEDSFALAFLVRMVFSCLVDADYLDTEGFMSPERRRSRPAWPGSVLSDLETALTATLTRIADDTTEVNRLRGIVLADAISAATRTPGFFTFTVPTGGGKTLSSMAFALRHALRHGKRRVIYVCPFTSIIEQNAEVFRGAFGQTSRGFADPVIEHHSNLDPDEAGFVSRLASENWDAPVIVTTGVQFYESLFANRSSRCRKLHNLADSVIILDEAQALPVNYLSPCLRALEQLVSNYGATVVLCTATQPAVGISEEFPIGLPLDSTNEIVSNPELLFDALRRVEIEVLPGVTEDADVVNRLQAVDQGLCVVNTRHHARELFDLLEPEGAYHLSALMCAQHRSEMLAEIHERLKAELPCRVVSTRLIEAGVDIDFPLVIRSMAGLDSIAQAAGRCNRNGRQATGRVVVFRSEHGGREGFVRETADVASQVLELHDDPLAPDAIEQYFRMYYWQQSDRWDKKKILDRFSLDRRKPEPETTPMPFVFGFRSADRDFRLIEDSGRPVIVPWGVRGEALVEALRASYPGPTVTLLRHLQRYTVQITQTAFDRLLQDGLEMIHDDYAVLAFPDRYYDCLTGLSLKNDPSHLLQF